MYERVRTTLLLLVRYMFLTRFSWMLGGLLVSVVPICRDFFPSLLANLLVLDLPQQVYHVSWISFWCAATVMETLRVTTLNAQYRFEDYDHAVADWNSVWHRQPADDPLPWRHRVKGLSTFLLGLGVAFGVWFRLLQACISSTANDPSPSWRGFVTDWTPDGITAACWQWALRGLLTSLVVLGTLHLIAIAIGKWARWRDPGSWYRTSPFHGQRVIEVVGWRRWIHRLIGPGYFREITDPTQSDRIVNLRLAPGHLRLVLFTIAFATWYLINFLSATGQQPMPTEASPYPALFYGLLSLLLAIYLFPGFAFFLDRYRIPVTLSMLAVSIALYGGFGTDHFYELETVPPQSAEPPLALDTIYDQWELPTTRAGQRTLVVVDASGGGIQAAAWSAQVLSGLHEVYGERFSRSLGLISAVSGGSVGSMFYLANRADMAADFDKTDPSATVLPAESIERIRWATRASALEATAWGVAYPDTIRLMFPPAVSSTVDRGWALERVWRQRSADGSSSDLGDLWLTDLAVASHQRQLPVAVFNATLMETGQRFVMSPVLGPRPDAAANGSAAVELLREFPSARLRVSTAARLSSTFPYVTPAVRALVDDPALARSMIATHHVVDGGYADNEGVVTSVDWLNRLLQIYGNGVEPSSRPFDAVLLIRIHAFPSSGDRERNRSPSPLAGWRAALVGPLHAMLRVRSASQTERGDLEIRLLKQSVERASRGSGGSGLRIESVKVAFYPPPGTRVPLSWKLTESQKRELNVAWQSIVDGSHPDHPLKVIDRFFERDLSRTRSR